MLHSWLTIPFFFFFLPRYTSAEYTWSSTSQPIQCQNVSIAIQGSGQPPYNILIIPWGPTSLPNDTEVRAVQNFSFTGSSTSFNLNYPENNSFVAVVSDTIAFGSGGASDPVVVLPSSDSSCYDPAKGIQLPWFFYIDPVSGLTQCELVRLFWDQDLVNGTVNFFGLIPGGEFFDISQGPLSTTDGTTGFYWTVGITGGTQFLLVGGDDRGIGSGGSVAFTIGISADGSCLNGTSPSTTAGGPAGGSYPTSISSSPSSGSGDHSNAIPGAVAGGIVAIVALALITFVYSRRRGYSAISRERPVNVLYDHEDGDISHLDLPHHYAVEPYLVSDLTVGETAEAAFARDRPLTTADTLRPQTLVGLTAARKSGSLPPLRPVNVIQHDDACPGEWPASVGEHETVELPPAYGNIRSAQHPLDTASAPTTASISTPTTMMS